MRLGGRLAAAIEVLEDIDRRHRPAADTLKDWGLSHRFAGAGDRSAIGNIVYDALRRKRSAGWLLGADTPRGVAFGALLLAWRETVESLDQTLAGDKFGPAPLTDEEHRAIASRSLADAPEAVRADCPDWCVDPMRQIFGNDWADEGAALSARPPLDLRVNTLISNRERVLAELDGTGAAPTELATQGLRIPAIDGSGRHPNVQSEPAFQKGWFEVQDEGSQIAAELSGAEPGTRVLDFCAGAGGKTLALAALMQNTGEIIAHDSDKSRLAPIFERVRRAEASNIDVVSRLDRLEGPKDAMDLVLIDAPCTGSGTWRRRPDAKWRLSQKQLDVRRTEQASILDAASAHVKPGGRLVYVTCSVFRSENHDQIDRFLGQNPEFAPVDHDRLFAERFPGKASAARIEADRGIMLSPARSGTDGFFFAAMTRVR